MLANKDYDGSGDPTSWHSNNARFQIVRKQ